MLSCALAALPDLQQGSRPQPAEFLSRRWAVSELTGRACLAQDERGAGAGKLRRMRRPPVRLPFAPERGWQRGLWAAVQECVTSLGDFMGHPWRPAALPPDEHHITGFPSQCVGTMRSALYQEARDGLCAASRQVQVVNAVVGGHASCSSEPEDGASRPL